MTLCASPSWAATAWNATPGSGSWNTAGNWSAGAVPTLNQSVSFNASSITAITLSGNCYARAITFSGTSNFTLSGGAIYLGDTGGGAIGMAGGTTQTINDAIRLNFARDYLVNRHFLVHRI